MHQHFADQHDHIGLGSYSREYAARVGSSPSPVPTPSGTRQIKVDGRTKTVPAVPNKSAEASAAAQVREAVKDGAISTAEHTLFDKTPATKDARKSLTIRLADAVKDAVGHPNARDTKHEQRVDALAATKDLSSLDALDAQIKTIEASGSPLGLEALKAARAERAAAEGRVAAVIEKKESLVGLLEAEKLDLASATPPDAADNFAKLRDEAKQWIGQFNENDGQYYEGNDLMFDDWDASTVDFDRLASRFHGDPGKLAEFAKVQGADDGAGGDDLASMQQHYKEVLATDPELAQKISLRYQAATELQKIYERYNTARDAVDGSGARVGEIDAEISDLTGSIQQDAASLSGETLDKLAAANVRTAGILPTDTAKPTQPTPTKASPSAPAEAGPTDTAPAPDEPTPTPTETKIDYTTPERRLEVLAKAQEANLLPLEHATFNEQGQAIYTVQPNDSYWRITDMSDGKPQNEFDGAHFLANVNSNSERLGRDPQIGMIHPNDELIIANRSIDELIALLGLPAVMAEEAAGTGPTEPEDAPHNVPENDRVNGPR